MIAFSRGSVKTQNKPKTKIESDSLTFHPACLAFPELSEDELQALAADIKKHGLLNDITLLNKQILEGRSRYKACKIAGVKPRFVEWAGTGSPTEWVISQNLIRRHLTSSQRAVVALELLPLLEAEAKDRQRLSCGRGKKGVKKDTITFGNGRATEAAAKLTHSNFSYVAAAKAIKEQAPELIDVIRAGKLTIPDGKTLAKLPRQQRKGIRRQIEQGQLVNGSVRAKIDELIGSTTDIPQLEKIGPDGKYGYQAGPKPLKAVARSPLERKTRIEAVTLIHGDCRKELKKIASHSVDAIITDPIYPEVNRQYGRITEEDWHNLMRAVVGESRRILKPKGSAVFILQPSFENLGKMRLWIYDFVAWAGRELGLVQDCYWWSVNCLPTRSSSRKVGLLRQSIKWCVWLGPPDCYRNQEGVLWEPSDAMAAVNWSDRCLRNLPSGHTVRPGRVAATAIERGGVTPFNILPLASTNPVDHCGHSASTPYKLAAWWCRYILPPGGVLLDPFVGGGTMLMTGLDCGASKVIGIDKEQKYLAIAKRRIAKG